MSGFWLFIAIWAVGSDPSTYKTVMRTGPFSYSQACYGYGAFTANGMQSADGTINVIGACIGSDRDPASQEFKNMWEMICASRGKPDACVFASDGSFVNPFDVP